MNLSNCSVNLPNFSVKVPNLALKLPNFGFEITKHDRNFSILSNQFYWFILFPKYSIFQPILLYGIVCQAFIFAKIQVWDWIQQWNWTILIGRVNCTWVIKRVKGLYSQTSFYSWHGTWTNKLGVIITGMAFQPSFR